MRLLERDDLVARMARVVRHDRARAVDDPHQLPDHAVGAERRRVRRSAAAATRSHERRVRTAAISRSPRCARSARRARRRARRAAGAARAWRRRRSRTRRRSRSRGRAVVGDLPERRLRRHRRDVERAREARADAEHEIGPAKKWSTAGRPRAARRAERERVVLGERALAVERRRDRRAGALGELHAARRSRPRRARPGRPRSRAARPRAAPARSRATSSAARLR